MHFHQPDCGEGASGRTFFGMARGGFPFGPGGPRFHFDFGGGDRSRGSAGGRRRMFGSGELRLVLLKLIADEQRHGYDLIRAIEELTHGEYAPSPGVVYPTLTLLEDMGQIAPQESEGARKKFAVTHEGRRELQANAEEVAVLMERLERTGEGRRRHARPEIGRAVGNLMTALKNRVAKEGWNEALLDEVVDIIDEAAKRVERLR